MGSALSPTYRERADADMRFRLPRGAGSSTRSSATIVRSRSPVAALHGITDAMVVEAPGMGVVLPAFLRFAEGAILVGQEVSFDVAFLGRDARRLGLPSLTAGHPVLDTRLLSPACVRGRGPEHMLEAVAERLGVKVIGRHSPASFCAASQPRPFRNGWCHAPVVDRPRAPVLASRRGARQRGGRRRERHDQVGWP